MYSYVSRLMLLTYGNTDATPPVSKCHPAKEKSEREANLKSERIRSTWFSTMLKDGMFCSKRLAYNSPFSYVDITSLFRDFLSGFHKRKVMRQHKAQEELNEMLKVEKKRIKQEVSLF